MKIGILTLALHTNYGGILQAYALQTVLKRMGHDVEVLSRDFGYCHLPFWKAPLAFLKRSIFKYVLRKDVDIFREYHHNKLYKLQRIRIDQFTRNNINIRLINSLREVHESDYDCIVVGSDQIWRKRYFTYQFGTSIENAYLDFAKDWNIKRIAYAASFGTDKWEYDVNETQICKNLLKDFCKVSVREQSGIRLCMDYLNKKVVQLLDPTLLLYRDDYLKLIQDSKTTMTENALFCYILDPSVETDFLIKKVSTQCSLKPYDIYHGKKADQFNGPLPSVEEWINCFVEAEFVLTDSFHACIFSIIFNKPFLAYGNKSRGLSRFESLLNTLGLSDRLISDVELINDLSKLTSRPNVGDILSLKKLDSLTFLSEI